MSTILAGTSGLQIISDNSGVLYLQTGASANSITLNASGAIGVGTTPTYGSAGQVLTSQGSGAAPTWQAPGITTGKVVSTSIAFS